MKDDVNDDVFNGTFKILMSCPYMASYMMANYGHAHHAF
jgi:hypothetical protein